MMTRLLLLCLLMIGSNSGYSQALSPTPSAADKLCEIAHSLSKNNPDSALSLFNECRRYYESVNDSSMVIECLLSMGNIQKIQLHYSEAYDHLWGAFTLVKQLKNPPLLQRVYQSLGTLNMYFMSNEEAEEYLLKSLRTSKSLNSKQVVVSSYYDLSVFYSVIKKIDMSNTYLDSCFFIAEQFEQDSISKSYLWIKKGQNYLLTDEYKKGLDIILQLLPLFENLQTHDNLFKNHKGFLTIIYFLMANAHRGLGDNHQAIHYYHKSLNAIKEHNTHLDMEIPALINLSTCYRMSGQYDLAIDYLMLSKEKGEKIFDTRSQTNQQIMKMKNKYKKEIAEKNEKLHLRNLKLSEQRNALLLNRVIIGSFITFAIVAILYSRNRFEKIRFKTELELTKFKEENAEQLIRQKNKELTAYTLQFVEKNKVIDELLEYIKENPPASKTYQSIKEKALKNKSLQWDEFKNHFIQVHKDFYDRLMAKHPNLSQNDFKHIAMVKLNLGGQEIADLSGISASSVHMFRHRLRKKMGLSADINFFNYIHSI